MENDAMHRGLYSVRPKAGESPTTGDGKGASGLRLAMKIKGLGTCEWEWVKVETMLHSVLLLKAQITLDCPK